MIINSENLFLIVLAIVWIVGAIIQDFKRREVDNIWNFSLIAFAISYRAAVSIYQSNYWFLLNGIIGIGLFFIIANLFYYSRLFAGGDAKLLIALGAILPLSYDWIINLRIFAVFSVMLLVLGSFYSLIFSFYLLSKNKGRFIKESKIQFKESKNLFLMAFIFSIFSALFFIFMGQTALIGISVVILLFPLLFIYSKSIEKSCMIRSMNPSEIGEGEWLYKDIFVNGKLIKSSWEGLSKKEISLIRKSKKLVLVKQGIPFTPAFLLGFIALLILIYSYGFWF
jgi:Flp pilus assembly protein protease CpaA